MSDKKIGVGIQDNASGPLKKISGAFKDFKNLFDALKSPLKEVGTNFEKIGKGVELLTKNQNSLSGLKTFFSSFKDNKESIKAVSEDLIKIQETIQKIGTSNMQALASIIRGGGGPPSGSTGVAPGSPGGGPPAANQNPGPGSGNNNVIVQQPNGSFKTIPANQAFGQAANRVSNFMSAGAGTMQSASNFGQLMRENVFVDAEQRGRIRSVQGGLMQRAVSGDMSDALAMVLAKQQGGSLAGFTTDRNKEMSAGRLLDVAGQSAAIKLGGAGNVVNNLTSANGPGAVSSLLEAGVRAGELEVKRKGEFAKGSEDVANIERTKSAILGLNPKEVIQLNTLQQQSGSLLSLNRNTGNLGATAAWKGVGAGMDPGETAAWVAQNRKFGQPMLMGKGAVHRTDVQQMKDFSSEGYDVANAIYQKQLSDPIRAMSGSSGPPKFDQKSAIEGIKEAASDSLIKAGYHEIKDNPGFWSKDTEIEGKKKGLLDASLEWQRKGIDKDAAAKMIGGVSVSTGKSISESQKMLEEAMARGMARGLQDPAALEALGTAVAENTTEGGVLSSKDLADVLGVSTLGLNKNQSAYAIESTARGLAGIQGANMQDPYYKAYSYQFARQNLGDNATRSQVLGLARGMTPGEAASLGVTAEQQNQTLEDKLAMNIGETEYGDELYSQYGGDVKSFIKGKGAFNVATRLKFGGGGEAFAGQKSEDLARALQGFSGDGKEMGEKGLAALWGNAPNLGGTALSVKSAEVKNIMDALTDGLKNDTVKKSVEAFKDMYKNAANVKPENVDSATKVLEAVEVFVDKILTNAAKAGLVEKVKIEKPEKSPTSGDDGPSTY